MQTLAKAILKDKNLNLLPSYVEGGALPALLIGPGATGRANAAAALRLETGRPLFVICADETTAANFRRDLAAFLDEPCETLFSRDMNFYGAEGVSREDEQKRLRTLCGLAKGEMPVVVCSVTGLLQRTMPPEKLMAASVIIEDGKTCPPETIEQALLLCGYERAFQVEGPGQFSRRGGILDFFLPSLRKPRALRILGRRGRLHGLF